jgi:hypothetical protein
MHFQACVGLFFHLGTTNTISTDRLFHEERKFDQVQSNLLLVSRRRQIIRLVIQDRRTQQVVPSGDHLRCDISLVFMRFFTSLHAISVVFAPFSISPMQELNMP